MAIEYGKQEESNNSINEKDFYGSEEELKQSQDMFVPSNDMAKLITTYLEETVPDELKKTRLYQEFWAVAGKTIKLTFFDKDDMIDLDLMYDNITIDFKMSKAIYDFSFEDSQMLQQFRLYFKAAVKRSVGTPQHRFNERIILGGSINQTIRSNTENSSGRSDGNSGGIFGKIKSWF